MLFTMFVLFLFGWLFFHSIGLALHLTWCAAKVIAALLFAVALPALLVCLFVCGGRPIAAGPAGADRRCFRHFEILRLTCYLSSYYYAHETGTQKHKGEIEL